MSATSLLRQATRRTLRPQTFRSLPAAPTPRALSQTTSRSLPKKGAEDKDSINTESSEHSKSATDNAAAQDEVAFDPNNTSPEGEMESAGDGAKGSGNPMEVSGANRDVSKQRDPQEGGAEKSAKEGKGGKQSGAGSPKKEQSMP